MASHPSKPRRTAPQDIVETIDQFRRGELRLARFLDRTWAQIHDLPEHPSIDLGALEDLWTEIEIIYAQASAANQTALDASQTEEVERTIDALAAALSEAL